MFLRLLGIAAIAVLVASCKEQPPAPTPTASTVLPRKASEPQVREPVSRFGERVDGISTIAGSRKTLDGYNEISVVLPGSDSPEQPYRMRFRCDATDIQILAPNGEWSRAFESDNPPPRSASLLLHKVMAQECVSADEKAFRTNGPPIERWMTELYGSFDSQYGVSVWTPKSNDLSPIASPVAEPSLRRLSAEWEDAILAEPFFAARLPTTSTERFLLAIAMRPERGGSRATGAALHLLVLERDAKTLHAWNQIGRHGDTPQMGEMGIPPKLRLVAVPQGDWMLSADVCSNRMGEEHCSQRRWAFGGTEFGEVLQILTKRDISGSSSCAPGSIFPQSCEAWTRDISWSAAPPKPDSRFPSLLVRQHGTIDLCERTEKIDITQTYDFVSGAFVERIPSPEFYQFIERAKQSPISGIAALSAWLDEPNNLSALRSPERSRDAEALRLMVVQSKSVPECDEHRLALLNDAIKLDIKSPVLYALRSTIAWRAYQRVAERESLTVGREHLKTKSLTTAHEAAIQTVAIDTTNAEAWEHLAIVMTLQRKTDELAEVITRTLKLSKDLPKTRANLARAADADQTGKLGHAISRAEEHMRREP